MRNAHFTTWILARKLKNVIYEIETLLTRNMTKKLTKEEKE
jgi:hypothetical protein